MSIPVAKVALGIGVTSGVAGLGYLSIRHLSPNTEKKVPISKLFEEQGRTLLTKGQDSDQWVSRWSSYVDEGKDDGKLKDYEIGKGDKSKVSDSFVDKCVDSSKVEVSGIEDLLYEQVVKNCSKEFTVSELIGKNSKFTSLDTSGSNEVEAGKTAGQNYLTDNEDGKNNPWELSVDTGNTVKDDKNNLPPDFKTKCNLKKDEKAFWEKDTKFLNFARWCSKSIA